MLIPNKVKEKLRELPDQPGVYLMRDRRGKIIYVGKALSLRKRVQSYFRAGTLRSADPKLRGLVRSVEDLEFIPLRTEAQAALTEGQLIKDYRPRYNVDFKDDKRFMLVRVQTADTYPRLEAVRFRRDDGAEYFGPYVSSAAARVCIDFAERRYGLRTCRTRIPGEQDHRHCNDDIIRTCSAPCVGKISPELYHERVREACSFLRGEHADVLDELREHMKTAAAELDFERARAYRDTLFFLQKADKERTRVGHTPQIKAEQAELGLRNLQRLLDLPEIPRVIECYDISNISGTYAVGSMVCAVDGRPAPQRYRRFRIKTIEGIDDPGMMAEMISRRFGRALQENQALPNLVLVDGGLTQLRAARAETRALGLDHLAMAGLAKRFEEIHMEEAGERSPLRLEDTDPGLLILRRIRDEAHRFAINYHRALRNRRIRDSRLDEVPGIGKVRKELLLKHFGSVRRMERASLEALQQVPGVGPELAKLLHDTLHAKREKPNPENNS